MFIPRGKAIHETLATSYVLVDALVVDLCQGGFSGIVELKLHDLDAYIIIACGKVAAVIESTGEGRSHNTTSLNDLAERSRRERGRVSVFSYSVETAITVAGRATASPLYTRLSTEFADLEKMISKLSRERDRQWFVEIRTESDIEALIHLTDRHFRLLASNLEEAVETDDGFINHPDLRALLEECNRAGGVFDVYFKMADEKLEPVEPIETVDESEDIEHIEDAEHISEAVKEAKAVYESLELNEPEADEEVESEPEADDEPAPPVEPAQEEMEVATETAQEDFTLISEQIQVQGTGALEDAKEAMDMAEIKRLMAEIARTIEESTRGVEQRDNFSMYLRAGQLKVADTYPFLDPFGAEFEYLSGEIVFIGKARPSEFVEGLTEALKLAVEALTQVSSQSARLKARISDDLKWLLDRHELEMRQYDLDQSIAKIINL
jgi:hypothetical protein